MDDAQLLRRIRFWLVLFIIGLILSGITAFPLHWEVGLLRSWLDHGSASATPAAVLAWLNRVYAALSVVDRDYPFLAYGTDWLAFAHLVIAMAFIGPLRDPVRNRWVITFGLIACAGVVPLALIAGQVRGIPLYWRLIDCSFGLFGVIPLLICRSLIVKLESTGAQAQTKTTPHICATQ